MKRPTVKPAKCCMHCVYHKAYTRFYCGLRVNGKTGGVVEVTDTCAAFKRKK